MSDKNLKVFKVITGEEIIAEVVDVVELDYQYTIKNALMLLMQQTDKGFGVAVVPWGNHVDGNIVLESDKLIYVAAPRKELVEMYEKAFSPLALPTKSLITG